MESAKRLTAIVGVLLLAILGGANIKTDTNNYTQTLSQAISNSALNKRLGRLVNEPMEKSGALEVSYDVRRSRANTDESGQASSDQDHYRTDAADDHTGDGAEPPVTLIRQSNPSHCGLAALAMLLSYYSGVQVSLASLEQTAAFLLSESAHKWETQGFSVGELQTLAKAFGIPIYADRVSLEELSSLPLPLMAWINTGNNGHFTVVQSWQRHTVSLADPSRGYLRLGQPLWERLWLKGTTGIVLVVDEGFQR